VSGSGVIGPALTALVVPVVLGWIATRARTGRPAERAGRQWVEYGLACKVVAIALLLMVAAPLVAMASEPDAGERVALVWVTLVFAVFAAYGVPEFLGVRVGFDERGLVSRSPWRATRHIAWDDIVGATYSPAAMWWVLRTRTQGVVRLHDYLHGREALFAELRTRTGRDPFHARGVAA
jgi:hypothetical protein